MKTVSGVSFTVPLLRTALKLSILTELRKKDGFIGSALDSDNLHTSVIAQLLEEAGAIFPSQSKRLHVSQTETRYRITYGVVIRLVKIGFHHGAVRPCYQFIEG